MRSRREMVSRCKVSFVRKYGILSGVLTCFLFLFQITRLHAGVPVVRRRLGDRVRTDDN